MIIVHTEQLETRGYYSRITNRHIVNPETGAQTCALWDQTIPAGGYISPHQHPTEEVLTFLSGRATVILAGQLHAVNGGTTVLVPAGMTHSVRNDQDRPVRLLAYFPTTDPQVIYVQPPKPVNWEESR